jgi:hypothetical protein
MLSEALQAPTRSDDAAGTMLVGSILLSFAVLFPLVWLFAVLISPIWVVLAPLAVFPPLVLLGYDVRVLEAGLRGEPAAPSFVDWAGLVRDGLRSLVLSAAVLVPLFVALGVGVAAVWFVQSTYVSVAPDTADAVAGLVVLFEALFVVAYLTAYLYVRPAVLAAFAATGSLRAALSPRRTLRVMLSPSFALAWTLANLALFVGWLVAFPLQLLLVGFAVAFFVRVVAYGTFGRGARGALADDLTGGREDAAGTATAPAVVPDPSARWGPREVDAAVGAGRGVPFEAEPRADGPDTRNEDGGPRDDDPFDWAEGLETADRPE